MLVPLFSVPVGTTTVYKLPVCNVPAYSGLYVMYFYVVHLYVMHQLVLYIYLGACMLVTVQLT